MPEVRDIEHAFTTLAVAANGRHEELSARVNGMDCKVWEYFRFRNSNGYEVACVDVLHNGRHFGPLLANAPLTEGWGYDWKPDSELDPRTGEFRWNVPPAFAAGIQNILIQRDVLAQKLRDVVAEVNSNGYLQRSEDLVSEIETLLEKLK